jgi:hypothetical protein
MNVNTAVSEHKGINDVQSRFLTQHNLFLLGGDIAHQRAAVRHRRQELKAVLCKPALTDCKWNLTDIALSVIGKTVHLASMSLHNVLRNVLYAYAGQTYSLDIHTLRLYQPVPAQYIQLMHCTRLISSNSFRLRLPSTL